MKYEKRLLIRIIILILITLFFNWFYKLFYPPTIGISYVILKLFLTDLQINFAERFLYVGCGGKLMFTAACIAGSAYYLWSLLVLSMKDLGKKAWKLWLYGVLLILGMNILRIIILILVLVNLGSNWFDLIHLAFWRFVAGIYVALVWIFLVNKLKIKSIPVYSDVKELLRLRKPKKVRKKRKSVKKTKKKLKKRKRKKR